MSDPKIDVQYQLLVLSHLLITPSNLSAVWIAAIDANDFTPVANLMEIMGFSDKAVGVARTFFTQGKLPKATLVTLKTTIATLPPYDGAGAHPNNTQAETLARMGRSIDRN